MSESRSPSPGRGPRSPRKTAPGDETNPYKDGGDAPAAVKTAPAAAAADETAVVKKPRGRPRKTPLAEGTGTPAAASPPASLPDSAPTASPPVSRAAATRAAAAAARGADAAAPPAPHAEALAAPAASEPLDRLERSERSERVERSERAARPERAAPTERAERAEPLERVERAARPERTVPAEQRDGGAQDVRADGAERVVRTERSAPVDRDDRSGAPASRGDRTSDRGGADRTGVDRDAVDRNAGDRGSAERGPGDHNATDRNATDRNATDRSATDRSATDRSATDRNATDRGATDRNNSDRLNGDRNERQGRFQRRRGRGRNKFRDGTEGVETAPTPAAPRHERAPRPERNERPARNEPRHERGPRPERGERQPHQRENREETPGSSIVTAEATITGWYDPARGDGGFIRRAAASYLPQPGDPFIPGWLARQFQLRRADLVTASWGHDQRRRPTVCEITSINEVAPDPNVRRKDFKSLTASYPNKRLTLETGRPAKVGPEITRRAIDLIAPIGYGQRALIVAPARAGKTTLLQAITEGVHLNHPDAILMLLLVDERPEEVSEAISWEVGEVIASSFDQPAQRHVDVTELVTERAHRLVEMGKDVVIVLDSITRMGRAFNTANRGTGRTMSGGLDANAMAKPKAFFGSARNVAPEDGGGSLTIIATALVETGSRMDDVIFEEFKGTGNCEIKLDRSLSERRIFPAIDIPASGTRREEKLYKPEQVQSIYMLRRGLQQMPPMGAMEWLIKRISATTNNDALLAGL